MLLRQFAPSFLVYLLSFLSRNFLGNFGAGDIRRLFEVFVARPEIEILKWDPIFYEIIRDLKFLGNFGMANLRFLNKFWNENFYIISRKYWARSLYFICKNSLKILG